MPRPATEPMLATGCLSAMPNSEPDGVASLEREHLARLAGAGDLQREVLDDRAHDPDLLRVRPGEPALARVQAVFEPDPDVAPMIALMVTNPSW